MAILPHPPRPRARSRLPWLLAAALGIPGCAGPLARIPIPPATPAAPGPAGAPAARPLHPRAAYHFAYAQMARAEGRRAIEAEHLQRALFYDRGSAFLHAELARAWFEADRMDAARRSAERATQADPDHPSGWRMLGQIALYQDRLAEAEVALRRAVVLDPDEDTGHFYLFRTLAQAGRVDAALVALDEYRRNARREEYPLLLRAELLTSHQRHDEALATYREVFAVDPYNRTALEGMMEVYTSLGRRADAARDLEKLADEVPDNRDVKVQLVDLYAGLGRHDDALRLLRLVYDEDPANRSLYAAPLARLLIQLLRLDEAMAVIDQVLDAEPGDGTLTVLRGEAVRLQGDEEQALAIWETVGSGDDAWAESVFRAVALLRARGDLEQASRRLSGAAREAKQDPRFLRARVALLRESGRHDEAGALLPELRALDAGSADVAEAWLLADRGEPDAGLALLRGRLDASSGSLEDALALADLYQHIGRPDPAIEVLARALERVESPAEAVLRAAAGASPEEVQQAIRQDRIALLVQVGFLHGIAGRVDESVRWTRRVLDIDPDNATALNNIGYTLVEAGRDLAEAEAMIRKALEIEPLNASYLDSLGWACKRQGRIEEAIASLEQAARREPHEAVILDHLGDAYSAAGRTEDAVRAWRRALATAGDPTNPDDRAVRERVPGKLSAAGAAP